MGEAEDRDSSLRREFRELGKNLKRLVRTAWEHDERKRIQNEVEEGLIELQSSLENLISEFRASPAGERMHAQTKRLTEAAQAGDLELKVQQEFGNALHKMNAEIQAAIEALEDAEQDVK